MPSARRAASAVLVAAVICVLSTSARAGNAPNSSHPEWTKALASSEVNSSRADVST